MEKKKFNRGTMTGGIVRIAIALVAVAIAVIVISSAIASSDPDDRFGTVFMCIIGGIMIVAAIGFIGNGIKMIIDGKKSLEVASKGHSENGRITDLTATEVTENNNGCVSNYTIYSLKFEYTDDNGNLCESEEQISQKIFEKLQQATLVPILVYGERAIFDKKRFDEENFG
ncbi:MAG TPA: hypothetical protein DDY77_06495 [Clostridiales bacterium]|nr:hypothetical protein [Clostridiales bacterium]